MPLAAGNPRLKQLRRLSRRSERVERRLFLVEGPKAVAEALAHPDLVVEVLATTDATERHRDLRGLAPGWTVVADRALAALADTAHPQGVVAVCRFLDVPLADVVTSAPRLVAICAEVRDPGNAGTVIRTADAAGADAVVLAGTSVDPYNPKAVRATVGSLFHLPVAVCPDPAEAVETLRGAGLVVLAGDGAGELDLFDADAVLARPTAWLFGNEAHGLPEGLAAAADHRVRVPLLGGAESLNLASAAAVCLYASARAQRS